jgi:hypothetical protein
MAESPLSTPEQEHDYHTYTTHRIPWYAHVMWVGFGILLIWYVIRYAIPSARSYF